MAQSDPNRILRLLPLVIGGLGGTLLFVNRLITADLTNSQSRSDALGVILSAILILTGLLMSAAIPHTKTQQPSEDACWRSAILLLFDFTIRTVNFLVPSFRHSFRHL